MNVIFYNIGDPPEKVTKITDANEGTVIEGVNFIQDEALDIERPKIVLNRNVEIAKNVHFTYCRIPKLGRYYFITKITTVGGLMVYELEVDPLQSFRSDILNSTQYIIRSEKFHNVLITDPLLPFHSDHNILIKEFDENVFDKECVHVILETIGQGGTVS